MRWPDSPNTARAVIASRSCTPRSTTSSAGAGLASRLIKDTLDEMRARGIAVLPYCPFVKRYIQRHADYQDLVPADQRATFEIPAG